MAQATNVLLVSTKRGLFVLTSRDREHWTVGEHALAGQPVYNAMLDVRNGKRMYATENNVFFGVKLKYSDDMGMTWEEPKRGIEFPEDSGKKLQAIWTIEPGKHNEKTVFVGVDPASLWVSEDGGENWEVNQDLLNHETVDRWNPGNGGLCLHSIIQDYSNPDRMWIGISAVGCMRTDDGGKTWKMANKGTRAPFLPDPYPEFGQCIHRVVQHPNQPDVLYQQNHAGVYKSTNAGDEWIDIQGTLPSEFGFPIALDPHNPDTVFTIVEEGWGRFNFGDQFTVYRSRDGGQTWEALTNGLPSGKGVKLGVLRHGMCTDQHDPVGVYVGTNTGQLLASTDRGDSWKMIMDFLPPINAVTVATIE